TITESTAGFPLCSSLPSVYSYNLWLGICGDDINKGATFAVAHLTTANPPNWSCNLQPADSGNTGPICRWKPGALTAPSPSPHTTSLMFRGETAAHWVSRPYLRNVPQLSGCSAVL